jgi:alpha-2-macroglobulin
MNNDILGRILFLLLLVATTYGAAGETLQVIRVSPDGQDVPTARQIVIQFNHSVVPLGKMSRKREEVSISISPPVDCQWRWLDRSSLACQLDDKNTLQKATRYSMVIWPGIRDQQGETIAQPYVHEFMTVRPDISRAWFVGWKAPGHPLLDVVFNQAVSRASVAAHVFFTHKTKQSLQRIEAVVEPKPEDENFRQKNHAEFRRVWRIQPQYELPHNSTIKLQMEPGLVSLYGAEASVTDRTVIAFDTFPEFSFIGIFCYDNHGKKLLLSIKENKPRGKCNPLNRVGLNFSTPVLNSEIKNKVLFRPDLAGSRKDYDPWANRQDYSQLLGTYKKGQTYTVWLPEILKAATQYDVQEKPGYSIQDEFGRELMLPLQQSFYTDHRNPDYKLGYRYSVMESQIDSELPVYVTNLDKLTLHYKTLTSSGAVDKQQLLIDIPKVKDLAFAMPVQVREMLGGKSGIAYGSVEATPAVKKTTYQRQFFAQVTPYQVHVKLGHFNSLVWVTDLASGEVVADADVTIYKDAIATLAADKPVLEQARTNQNGVALFSGMEKLDAELKTFSWRCNNNQCPRLLVRVEKQGELAVLPLISQFEVNTYRISDYTVFSRQQKKYGHLHSWGTTAQGVYRAGDTMQYKFYVRNQDNQRFVAAPKTGYTLGIVDPAGKVVKTLKDLVLSEFGSFNSEFKIPETAVIGWYRFRLKAKFSSYEWEPMKVLVSDFTPAAFKVKNELNGDLFHPGEKLEVVSMARLHSGGAYTDAQVRVTVNLQARHFYSDDPQAKGFSFDTHQEQANKMLMQKIELLDGRGEQHLNMVLPETKIIYGKLTVESSVQDDRGKYIAAQASADYVSVDRLVGLKSSQWLFHEDEPAAVQYLVVDANGKPVAGQKVKLSIQREETVSARVKGAGNAYITQFNSQWVDTDSCSGTAEVEALTCRFVPDQPGTYQVIATISDTRGNTHSSSIKLWVAGKGRVVWRQPNSNSLQIIAEQTVYKVGDTASYLIKNPYPGANALVTLERYGILKQWLVKLQGSTPVIDFAIDKDLLPGFYLSVIVMSPRVAKPLGEGEVDLGKPAFKIGYVEVPVNDPWKQIKVQINTNAEVYRPRDRVQASIQATVQHGEKAMPIELAVVVLDESVLDLISGGTRYFDPYQGFYRLDGLDVRNFGLLTRLVGRQKFAKKGANSGGDGGAAISMRSLFDYVSYWNPSLITDAQGQAHIEFNLPDNLTGWRILAMAVTPGDRMGLGEHAFKVNQPTEIRPLMPNQVTEGDQFQAGFSIMNRTDRQRELSVVIKAEGDVESSVNVSRKITLDPYKRQSVFVDVTANRVKEVRNSQAGQITFSVEAFDGRDGDALQTQLPVHKRRVLMTAAEYGSMLTEQIQQQIMIPEDIYPDTGSISVNLSPSVIGNLAGSFRYMQDYPYSCWEQKLSKGVAAAQYNNLQAYLPDDLNWKDSTVLPQNILDQAANYQSPNGGMVYFYPNNEYVSPYLSAYTALAFSWLRDSGYQIPGNVQQKLHGYLQKMLRKDVFPGFYSKGMSSTVRAVALAALSRQGEITLADLQRYRRHVARMSLFGKAHYLQAALRTKGAQGIVKSVQRSIEAHAQQSGGKIAFNEELGGSYARLLATPLRANCAILSALTQKGIKTKSDRVFKLLRTITQTRGKRDHWQNTQENLFCLNAIVDYSRRYESVPPDMLVSVGIDKRVLGKTGFNDFRDAAVNFVAPLQAADAGKQKNVSIERQGKGRLYHTTRLQYASRTEQNQRVNAGMDIRREYSVERNGQWLLLDQEAGSGEKEARIKRGELVRVDIYVSLPTARNFIVVEDFVPGGLEPVNRDLATTSSVDAGQGDYKMADASWWFQYDDWQTYHVSRWSFYHQEIKHDAVRFYADYLPAGRYHLAYTAQAITTGTFARSPVHAEEMYDPDVFGKGRGGVLIVEEQQ